MIDDEGRTWLGINGLNNQRQKQVTIRPGRVVHPQKKGNNYGQTTKDHPMFHFSHLRAHPPWRIGIEACQYRPRDITVSAEGWIFLNFKSTFGGAFWNAVS
jgi:hypothetical protein